MIVVPVCCVSNRIKEAGTNRLNFVPIPDPLKDIPINIAVDASARG